MTPELGGGGKGSAEVKSQRTTAAQQEVSLTTLSLHKDHLFLSECLCSLSLLMGRPAQIGGILVL